MVSRVKSAVLVSAAALGLAAPATAQRFNKVVAFGDSYADTGNLKGILTGSGLGALYPSAEYPTGRFSGGTNFVDTIATAYGIPDENYAIGGAEAGNGNVAGQGLIPGFRQQWTAFTQGATTYSNTLIPFPIYVSGVQTPIPAGGLNFSADDLAVFSVGGNDARDYRIAGGTVAGAPAAASAVANQAITGLDALVSRGIRHLVWTAGDVGQLAEAIGTPSAAAGSAFSVAYNDQLKTELARIAGRGVQVAYVDITSVGDVIRADPARFGFTDIVHACPVACEGNTQLQNQYLFYVDGVHLTSAGFALVGEYAVNQLDAPFTFRANGDVARLAAQQFGQDVGDRLDLVRRGSAHGLTVYGNFAAGHRRFDGDASANGYDFNARGGTGGVEYGFGPATVGVMGAYSRDRLDEAGDDRVRGRSYQLAGYATAELGRVFGQIYGGYGWHHLDIRRTGVVDPLTASPHAHSVVAGARTGYLVPLGIVRVGPSVAVDWASARLNGYTESGDVAGALTVHAQRSDVVTGSAGLEARADLVRLRPWLRVAAEKDLAGDGRTLFYAPSIAPEIVNSFAIGNESRRTYGTVAGGLTAGLMRGVSLGFTGRATFARDQGNEALGQVGLQVGF
jgi:outer membrane lipase/esterase